MSNVTTNLSEAPVTEEASAQQVADYLLNHPDFLEVNSYLLTELTVKHQSGQSISLVERQVAALRQENQQLKQQLSTLISNAHQNDQLLEKTKALILELITCSSIDDIRRITEERLTNDFGSSACRLWLLNEEESISSLSFNSAQKDLARFLDKNHVYCGLLREQEKTRLFANEADQVGSAAIMPLRHNGETLGLLAIGSLDQNYYRENISTTLLEYVGNITATLLAR